jgi:O-antigen/teichoic acid export membrane protein
MRSVSFPRRSTTESVAIAFTEGESSFRNAKLTALALVAYKTVADTAGKGSVFLITIVAARRLSSWDFGAFGLGTTLGWMLAVACDFGVQMHLARAVARAPQAAPALLGRWWRFRVATTAVGLLVLAVVLLAARVGTPLAIPILLFASVYAVTGLVELLNYFYRGLSRTDVESTLTIGQRTATLACALAALAWRPDVKVLAAAMLAPAIGALVWSIGFARRAGTKLAADRSLALAIVLDDALAGASNHDTVRDRFLRDVFPIGAGIVLSALYFRIDVLLVQLWAGVEAVASYNGVFRLIDALRLVPAAVLAVVLPSLCRAEDLGPLVRVSAAVTAFGVVASAVLWIAAEPIVSAVFGSTYAGSAHAFRILALSFPLLCLNFALTHQLVGWNRERAYAAICAAALVVNLVLNAWLIPALSIEGAAWATLGTELCVTAGCAAALAGRA